MMVNFRKRLSADILKEVNALIIERSKADDEHHDDDEKEKGSGEGDAKKEENKGTLIVDATCAPEDMRFPHGVTFWMSGEGKRKPSSICSRIRFQRIRRSQEPIERK